ncbi:MAG: hypothetical protein U9P79_06535 [Candidatus Cloacimonadota bacterium]|nr:hypothetical protein [Candidatus Cloacimonadota bacterium]
MKKWIRIFGNSFSKEEFKTAFDKIERVGIDAVLLNGNRDCIEKSLSVLANFDLEIHAWKPLNKI